MKTREELKAATPYKKNDDMKHGKTYYNLRLHSTYMKAINSSSKIRHLINILTSEGFDVIESKKRPKKLDKQTKKELKALAANNQDAELEELLDGRQEDAEDVDVPAFDENQMAIRAKQLGIYDGEELLDRLG